MEFDEAKVIGDAGERAVERELARLQPEFGFTVLHDVLVARGRITAQFDHALVDDLGVLVIETKVRDAVIRGTDLDKKWTAVYAGGRTETFQNPLSQSDHQRNLLRQVLVDAGLDVGPDDIGGLVIFACGDLSRLEMGSVARPRVRMLSGLRAALQDRRDFVSRMPLSTEQRQALVDALVAADRSTDSATTRMHAKHRSHGAPAPSSVTPTSTAGMSGSHARPQPTSLFARLRPWQWVLLAALIGAGIGFAVWSYRAVMSGNAPMWLWVVWLVILGALGGTESADKRRRTSRSRQGQRGYGRDETARLRLFHLALGLVLALGVIAVAGYGVMGFMRSVVGLGATSGPEAGFGDMPPAPGGKASVEAAQVALKAAAPDIYAKLKDPDNPAVGEMRGYPSYTWEYRTAAGANTPAERITIVLNQDGQMIAVTSE